MDVAQSDFSKMAAATLLCTELLFLKLGTNHGNVVKGYCVLLVSCFAVINELGNILI